MANSDAYLNLLGVNQQGGTAPSQSSSGESLPVGSHADDVAKARAERDALAKQLQEQQGRPVPAAAPAPTVGPTQVEHTAQAGPVYVAPAGQATAATAAGVPQVVTRQIAASQPVTARTFEQPMLGPAATATAQQAQAVNATAASVDAAKQQQVRDQQQQLNSALVAAGFGTGGPSATEQTMAQSTDRAIAAQRAIAAGARGTGHVTAGLTAANNIAQLTQEGARQSAILRAQEQQQARGQAVSALEGTRGADIGLATTNAQLQQGANLQNSQLGTQVGLQNASLGTQVSQQNAQEANRTALAQGQLTEAEREANQRAGLTADLANQSTSLQRETTMSQQDLQAALANQSTAAANSQFNAGQTNQVGLANVAAQNRMQELQAQIDAQQGIANASQQNEMSKLQAQLNQQTGVTNAQNQLQTNLANLDAALKSRGLDDQQRAVLLQALAAQQGQVLNWDQGANVLSEQRREGTLGFVGGLLGAGGSVGAAAAGAPK